MNGVADENGRLRGSQPQIRILRSQRGRIMRVRAEKGVVLYAGDVPTYVGQAGRDSHNRAVQVSGRWSKGK